MSLFITFEGGEGCGKSLQSRLLHRKLEQASIPSIMVYEPGSTLLGDRVRRLLKKACDIPISPLTELMLFNAARSQLVTEIIHPGLKENKVVICDRFADSTVAYQHYGRGVNLLLVKEISRIAAQGCQPDVTFLLDVPPEIGLARKQADAQDRFEQEDLAFHRKVRLGFLKLATEEPQRWVIIDSTLPATEIAASIWTRVSELLQKR
jgi:dTMP kinase